MTLFPNKNANVLTRWHFKYLRETNYLLSSLETGASVVGASEAGASF